MEGGQPHLAVGQERLPDDDGQQRDHHHGDGHDLQQPAHDERRRAPGSSSGSAAARDDAERASLVEGAAGATTRATGRAGTGRGGVPAGGRRRRRRGGCHQPSSAAVRTMARSRALSARGLAAISEGDGFAGTPEDETVASDGAAYTGQVRRTDASARGRLGKRLLREAVLARVVADHRTHATDGQVRQGDRQRSRELTQLVVDLYPQGLEDPAGRVALPAGRCGYRRCHDFGQFPRRGEWPGPHDGAGDTPGQPPLSVLTEQRCQRLLRKAVHKVRCRQARGRGPSACREARPGGRKSPARGGRAAVN